FATPIETTAYRVVQEALTNVARHSNAISASVQFLADIETMTIVIRDNGRGFDLNATADAGGLSGMRERVELLDGTWSIETEVGAGTLITAELPLSGSDSEGSIHLLARVLPTSIPSPARVFAPCWRAKTAAASWVKRRTA